MQVIILFYPSALIWQQSHSEAAAAPPPRRTGHEPRLGGRAGAQGMSCHRRTGRNCRELLLLEPADILLPSAFTSPPVTNSPRAPQNRDLDVNSNITVHMKRITANQLLFCYSEAYLNLGRNFIFGSVAHNSTGLKKSPLSFKKNQTKKANSIFTYWKVFNFFVLNQKLLFQIISYLAGKFPELYSIAAFFDLRAEGRNKITDKT